MHKNTATCAKFEVFKTDDWSMNRTKVQVKVTVKGVMFNCVINARISETSEI